MFGTVTGRRTDRLRHAVLLKRIDAAAAAANQSHAQWFRNAAEAALDGPPGPAVSGPR